MTGTMTNAERIEALLKEPRYAKLLQLAIERKEVYDDDPDTEGEMPIVTALDEALDSAESWASEEAEAKRMRDLGRDLYIEAGYYEDITDAIAEGRVAVSHGKPYDFKRRGRKWACRDAWSIWIEK